MEGRVWLVVFVVGVLACAAFAQVDYMRVDQGMAVCNPNLDTQLPCTYCKYFVRQLQKLHKIRPNTPIRPELTAEEALNDLDTMCAHQPDWNSLRCKIFTDRYREVVVGPTVGFLQLEAETQRASDRPTVHHVDDTIGGDLIGEPDCVSLGFCAKDCEPKEGWDLE